MEVGENPVDLVKQLRAVIRSVDPELLTVDDRIALVDLLERTNVANSVGDGSAA